MTTPPAADEIVQHDDKLWAVLDDVQRALATKGVMGRTVAIGALRDHFPYPSPDLTELMGRQAREIAGLVGKNNELDAIRQQHIRQIAALREGLENAQRDFGQIAGTLGNRATTRTIAEAARRRARALLAQSEGEG